MADEGALIFEIPFLDIEDVDNNSAYVYHFFSEVEDASTPHSRTLTPLRSAKIKLPIIVLSPPPIVPVFEITMEKEV